MELCISIAQPRNKPPRIWFLFLLAEYKIVVLGTTIFTEMTCTNLMYQVNWNSRNWVEWKETQDSLGLYSGLILVVIVFIVYKD